MRDTYYQSSGNPVQEARLPGTWPTLELLPLLPGRREVLQTIAFAFVPITVATLLTLWLYRPGGIAWLEPWDLIFCWPTLIGAVIIAIWRQRLAPVYHPVVLTALVIACVSHTTPQVVQIGLISTFAGLLVFLFGQHWATLATASPMSRAAAIIVRTRCERQLVFLGAILATALVGLLGWQSSICRMAIFTLPVAAIGMPAPRRLLTNRYKLINDSLISWLTHESPRLPGLVQAPIESPRLRLGLLAVAAILTSIVFNRDPIAPFATSPESFLPATIPAQQIESSSIGYTALAFVGVASYMIGYPPLVALVLMLAAAMPVLLDAGAERDTARAARGTVEPLGHDLRASPDRTERNSLFHGRVVADGSPVLIPREIYLEHAHALGDSGGGKTSLFLCPTVEQLASFADCSIVVLDLKADSLELLASLQAASAAVALRTGRPLPLKFFSNQRTRTTFAFNPMKQPFWGNFDLLTQTDILCAANGLTYGTDYGAGYFSSANAAILFQTLKTYPGVATFAELADCIGTVITAAKKRDLHPEIRKAGVHVHEVIKRLAACEALNVTESTGHQASVVAQAINLTDLFREPQLLYCHLPATLSPSGAPEIGRLFTYLLLAASTQTERRCPVFLVIDEFQRMVANNLEYMLQLARSMGVGVIIANQSMQDLHKGNVNLVPAIEANCRLRQWFSVSSGEDQERLIRGSGLTVETVVSHSTSVDDNGKRSDTYSESEHIAPRLTINDILLTNDHPFRSILRVSRGAGYAQFGGMPVVIESQFHISKEEYTRRKALPWPTADGALQPRAATSVLQSSAKSSATQPSFQWSEEVIGPAETAPLTGASEHALNALLDNLRDEIPATRRAKEKNR